MQWKVPAIGLTNPGTQFQRMMEWALRDLEFADPFIDDIIVVSTVNIVGKLLQNHGRDVRQVLETLRQNNLAYSPKKLYFFMRQVNFCVHKHREVTRSPAVGTLHPPGVAIAKNHHPDAWVP